MASAPLRLGHSRTICVRWGGQPAWTLLVLPLLLMATARINAEESLPPGAIRRLELPSAEDKVNQMSFSADGQILTIQSPVKTQCWNFQTGQLREKPHKRQVSPRAEIQVRSADRRVYADVPWVGSSQIRLDLEKAATLEKATTTVHYRLKGKGRSIRCLALSADGKMLASANSEDLIQLWETTTGEVMAELEGLPQTVICLAFSPDGHTFASADSKQTILIWDLFRCGVAADKEWQTPSEDELRDMWRSLGEDSAEVTFRTLQQLGTHPFQAIAFLKRHLPPSLDQRRLRQLLKDLDDDTFRTRQTADQELRKLGLGAETELRRTLKSTPSLEVHYRVRWILQTIGEDPVATLRWNRAVWLLERLESREAIAVLQSLADSVAGSAVIADARASLERRMRRQSGK